VPDVDENPEDEVVEEEPVVEALPMEEQGGPRADIDLAAMVGELQPIDGSVIADVVTDLQQYENRPKDLNVGQVPLPPKWIDLEKLDIAPFELEGTEPLEVKSMMENSEFIGGLEAVKNDLDEAVDEAKEGYKLGTEAAAGATLSLSAGFVSWVLRTGSLMASFMSVVPMWKQLDPLPILGAAVVKGKKKVDAKDGSQDEDEEVEEIFNDKDSR